MKNKKAKKTAPLSLSDKLIKNKREKFDNKFKLTPKGVLLIALSRYYTPQQKNSLKNLEEFEKELLQQLSLLVTDRKTSDEFGKNFNEFFQYIVSAINRCTRLEDVLHNMGLELSDETNLDEEQDKDENQQEDDDEFDD